MSESFYPELAVELDLISKISPGYINRILREMGAILDYDVYSFPRKDNHPIWQSESYAYVDLYINGNRVDAQDEVDRLKLIYPMATIPTQFITRFVEVTIELSDRLNVTPKFEDQKVDMSGLTKIFDKIVSELMTTWGEEPGSESLAILIESNFGRR